MRLALRASMKGIAIVEFSERAGHTGSNAPSCPPQKSTFPIQGFYINYLIVDRTTLIPVGPRQSFVLGGT